MQPTESNLKLSRMVLKQRTFTQSNANNNDNEDYTNYNYTNTLKLHSSTKDKQYFWPPLYVSVYNHRGRTPPPSNPPPNMAAANFVVITNREGCALNGRAVAAVLIN